MSPAPDGVQSHFQCQHCAPYLANLAFGQEHRVGIYLLLTQKHSYLTQQLTRMCVHCDMAHYDTHPVMVTHLTCKRTVTHIGTCLKIYTAMPAEHIINCTSTQRMFQICTTYVRYIRFSFSSCTLFDLCEERWTNSGFLCLIPAEVVHW